MLRPEEIKALSYQFVRALDFKEVDKLAAESIRKVGTASFDNIDCLGEAVRVSTAATQHIRAELEKKRKKFDSWFWAVIAMSYLRDSAIYKAEGLDVPEFRQSDAPYEAYKAQRDSLWTALTDIFTKQTDGDRVLFHGSFMRQLFDIFSLIIRDKIGGKTDEEAIKRAVTDYADAGPACIKYPSGRVDHLDPVMTRLVSDGLAQAAGKVTEAQAESLGWDLMQLSAHIGARTGDGGATPGNHSWWQGHVVSFSSQPGYLTLDEIGYGTAEGFLGINCRHSWYPYSEKYFGLYSQVYLDWLNRATVNWQGSDIPLEKAEQRCNAYRRRVQELERRLTIAETLHDTKEITRTRTLIQTAKDRYAELTDIIERKRIDYGTEEN